MLDITDLPVCDVIDMQVGFCLDVVFKG
ncbi:hypothetical protein PODOV026v1_p0002 [Vibrio phage PS32B.1]|nr:hypothetical protein PODOV028v1_20007 [Vibrio phage PS32B.3]QZI92175.1 hypothetical protein PODOV026v1_p0002 [Vibrio phage PS32B.1]QZI92280.1 hypothetical protein PODOV004v1_p0045 [Vibrio phage PS32B.11]